MLSEIGAPFIPHWPELKPFLADLWIIVTIVAVLLTPFFTRKSNLACALVALAGLTGALLCLLVVGAGAEISGEHLRGLLVADAFAVFWKALLIIFVMGIILMWMSVSASSMHEGDGPEFFTLLLGATLGMSLMASTSNLLMIFLAVEMASLPSYVLAGFRKTHRVGAEASLKYVLFGAATSSIMVFGLSLLYGLYGSLDVHTIATKMAVTGGGGALLAVSVFGLIVGIGFKISAVPFHFWCPDVFEGANVEVSAFLSVASKGAALALLLRQLMIIAAALGYQNAPHVSLSSIAAVIGILGAVTCTAGNTGAFVQTNIKRLLAYSSIGHAGYMLCALSLLISHNNAVTTGDENSPAQAILLYLAVYMFMNLGAFTVAGLVARDNDGSELIADYAGLGRRSPILAICMFCFMISLIGLPPFAGFVAKLNLMMILVNNGGWWWGLVVVIGVNTILSAFYYFRVIKAMFLAESDRPAFVPNPLGSAIALCSAIMLVVMLIGYSPFSNLTRNFSRVYNVGTSQPASVATAKAE